MCECKRNRVADILEKSRELNSVTFSYTGSDVIYLSTSGGVELVSEVPQGVTQITRTGKKIALSSFHLRGYITNLQSAKINVCSLALVYDKRPTNVIPAASDIYSGTVLVTTFPNLDYENRFEELYRQNFCITGNDLSLTYSYENTYQFVDWTVDLKERLTVFESAGTGQVGDHAYGALYLVAMGSSPVGSAVYSKFVGNARTRFTDV